MYLNFYFCELMNELFVVFVVTYFETRKRSEILSKINMISQLPFCDELSLTEYLVVLNYYFISFATNATKFNSKLANVTTN